MGASWGEYFESPGELRAHADFAVVGKVSSTSPATQPAQGPVFTMVTVDVERQLWSRDPSVSAPSAVIFEQTGGVYQNVKYEIDDDPLFAVGERVVLFIREYEPGKYKIVGGPTGRFAMSGNTIRAIAPDAIVLPHDASPSELLR
jgi:hypothetical protein